VRQTPYKLQLGSLHGQTSTLTLVINKGPTRLAERWHRCYFSHGNLSDIYKSLEILSHYSKWRW